MSAPPKGPPPPEPGYRVGDKLDAIPLAVVGTLLGIATITTALRIYWRARPTWRIGADDYSLIFAWVRKLSIPRCVSSSATGQLLTIGCSPNTVAHGFVVWN